MNIKNRDWILKFKELKMRVKYFDESKINATLTGNSYSNYLNSSIPLPNHEEYISKLFFMTALFIPFAFFSTVSFCLFIFDYYWSMVN